MARIKIPVPDREPLFHCTLEIRISDVNYGGHLGNDAVLALAQQARVQLLRSWDMTELDVGGCGIIMADAAVVYMAEGMLGDMLQIDIYAGHIGTSGWELVYVLKTQRAGKTISIATAKTGLVCYDYGGKRVVRIPAGLATLLEKTP